jgi:hypothetical protein
VTTYVVNCEKAGVPAVALGFADQIGFARNTALIRGVPNIRWVDTPRTGTGAERAATFIDKLVPALTDPLTAKEKESGLYTPPPPPRIIFEGTLLDAQEFFQQTTPVSTCGNCPIAKYTDGLPIIIPTEEAVREMLTGTSHKPDEQIYSYTRDATTGAITKGTRPVTYAGGYNTTVEKVATVAVMAGCKPEYLPAELAVASGGGGSGSCPGTSGPSGQYFVVSGPFAKEIGMNAKHEAMDVGNPANMTIGRSAGLMTVAFGGCITGVVRSDSGNPIKTVCFAEDDEGLPPGWVGFNEDSGYKKTESVLGDGSVRESAVGEYAPSSFRGLIGEGYGGIARRLGVEGTPGPHNFLEYLIPMFTPAYANACKGGKTLVMHPNMAKSLYDYGFKTKAAVCQWMYDTYFITAGQLRQYGWYDFYTAAGENKEPLSGIKYKDLPDDTKLHVNGTNSPNQNCILVCLAGADEVCYTFPSTAGGGARPTPRSIDVWK